MISHTPGPWDDASKYTSIPSVRIFAKTKFIATVGNSDTSRDQKEANARLIAAAPDLLEACENLLASNAARDDGAFEVAKKEARAAIAKATKPTP